MARKSVSLADKIGGKLKRAAGEIAGRPDLVIEGEAQDTGCAPETENSDKGARSGSTLKPGSRSDR